MCAVSGILDPTFSVTTVGMLIELSIHGRSEHIGVLERPFLGIEAAQRFSMSDSQGRRNLSALSELSDSLILPTLMRRSTRR